MLHTARKAAVILTLSGLIAGPSFGQQGAAEGPGTALCEALVASRTDNQAGYREFASWISGFLTAANAYEDDTYDLTPWQPIQLSMGQVHRYCEANPKASVAQAMSHYVAYLRPNRMTQPEEKTLIRNGTNGVHIYPSILAKVRGALIEQGFLIEGAPQNFGPLLADALERYQTSKNFEVNGLPDDRTLVALLN